MSDSRETEKVTELQPSSTGSTGEQGSAPSGTEIIPVVSDEAGLSHVGAVLGQHIDAVTPFFGAVAFAALQDAEASRRFLERQVEELQGRNRQVRDKLQTASTDRAVLESRIEDMRAVRWRHQVLFGIGAAVTGAGIGVALAGMLNMLDVLLIILGVVVMIMSSWMPLAREKK